MYVLILLLSVLCSSWVQAASTSKADANAAPVKAVSWNIRLDTPHDAELAWPHRAGNVIRQLQQQQPDIVGLQEVMFHQLQRVESAMPGYQRVGVGRDDGRDAGEFSPLFIRSSRFVIKDSGTFWFHPSWMPDSASAQVSQIGLPQIGQPGWDAALPRVCSWALLQDKHSGKWLRVLNLHLDHQGAQARRESVQLIAAKIRDWQQSSAAPVIIMGDFNPAAGDGLLAQLTTSLPQYQDALQLTAKPQGPSYSFIPWRGSVADAVRLDFILLPKEKLTVQAAGIQPDGPPTRNSDHLLLWAELLL